jgi:hypothetical protein
MNPTDVRNMLPTLLQLTSGIYSDGRRSPCSKYCLYSLHAWTGLGAQAFISAAARAINDCGFVILNASTLEMCTQSLIHKSTADGPALGELAGALTRSICANKDLKFTCSRMLAGKCARAVDWCI